MNEIDWQTTSPSDFLKHYWQKKPVLIRNALPSFLTDEGLNHFIDGNELAGLACEEGVESRLIVEQGFGDSPKPWQVVNGPLEENVFSQLPPTHWTLLVQDVEKHIPECADILEHFDFIPAWRMDDVMISYAEDGGSVGAHTDAYDVFLVQAQGQRHWQIAETFDNSYREDVELQILKSFSAEAESTLNPGDILYLPPNVAHHGVAMGECITWSIGFRAPSHADIINDYADHLVQLLTEDKRYSDPELTPAKHSAEISNEHLNKIIALQNKLTVGNHEDILQWWGQMVTSPKPWLQCEPLASTITWPELEHALKTQSLYRDTRVIIAYYSGNQQVKNTWLFVNGEMIELQASITPVLNILTQSRKINLTELKPHLAKTDVQALLVLMINQGWLILN